MTRWLAIAEVAAFILAGVGTIATLITQQVAYLALPLLLTVGLGLWRRYTQARSHPQRAIAQLQHRQHHLEADLQALAQQISALANATATATQLRQELAHLQQRCFRQEERLNQTGASLNQPLLPDPVSPNPDLQTTPVLDTPPAPQPPSLADALRVSTATPTTPTKSAQTPALFTIPLQPQAQADIALPNSVNGSHWQVWKTITAHDTWVSAIALSPDGEFLITGSADHTVKVWQLSTGDCLQTLTGHYNRISSLALSPDGTLLASGSYDHTIRLWQWQSGQAVLTLDNSTHSSDSVRALSFSPRHPLLVSGTSEGELYYWSMTGELEQRGVAHAGAVRSLAIHPLEPTVVSSGEDGLIRLWSEEKAEKRGERAWDASFLTAIAIHPFGTPLVVGSSNRTLQIWDWQSGKTLHTLTGHTGPITAVAFSPLDSSVISASADGSLKRWALATGAPIDTLITSSSSLLSLAISTDGHLLACGDESGKIQILRP
jgi:hypothetical protein